VAKTLEQRKKYRQDWYQANRERQREYAKAWYRENRERIASEYQADIEVRRRRRRELYREKPERARQSRLKNCYNLTEEQYSEMVQQQAGLCYLCHRMSKLFIDHDHVTGRVRRLLCIRCNFQLGHVERAVERGHLQLMLDYIQAHK
jgi:hypothetical protein